ncbi:hypothetical protein F5883DRAFT_665366 [Diaporthe sp. PMI_573]|nr:hypothetical protein F5883DRAFT_665366 [Diaporthaceae sp. PMI_573]
MQRVRIHLLRRVIFALCSVAHTCVTRPAPKTLYLSSTTRQAGRRMLGLPYNCFRGHGRQPVQGELKLREHEFKELVEIAIGSCGIDCFLKRQDGLAPKHFATGGQGEGGSWHQPQKDGTLRCNRAAPAGEVALGDGVETATRRAGQGLADATSSVASVAFNGRECHSRARTALPWKHCAEGMALVGGRARAVVVTDASPHPLPPGNPTHHSA